MNCFQAQYPPVLQGLRVKTAILIVALFALMSTASSSSDVIINGGFDSASLNGWLTAGTTDTTYGGHSGNYAAELGSSTATNGDSSISQSFSVPANGGTLSFWYKPVCSSTVLWDWATAILYDRTAQTSTVLLSKTCTYDGRWKQATTDLAAFAGHNVTLTLINHDDGDVYQPTYTLYDDVSLATGSGPDSTPSDFSLVPSTTSLNLTAGNSGNVGIATAVNSGSTQSISLSLVGLPAGATASFTPFLLMTGNGSKLVINAGTATAGSYAVTIIAKGLSATHTSTINLTITSNSAPPDGSNIIANGGFETASLNGWAAAGSTTVQYGGHTGNYAAMLGSSNSTAGDSTISQMFAIPASGGTLSFWYKPVCLDSVMYGWTTATLFDSTTRTISTLLPKTCSADEQWKQFSANMAAYAGHNVTLILLSHDDGDSGPTYTLFDDVSLSGNGGGISSDFSLSPSSTTLSLVAGTSGNVTISTAVTSGSSQALSLSLSGLPAGASAVLSPSSLTVGASSLLVINAGTAAPGSYTVAVNGSGANANHSVSINLSITSVPTAPPIGSNAIVNGGFDSANLNGWALTGTTNVVYGGHSGNYAAQVGTSRPTPGDSSIAQTFAVPVGGGTLSFWYKPVCPDSVRYDWATATLLDNVNQTTTVLLPRTCTYDGKWKQITADLSAYASHSVTLSLISHDDNDDAVPTFTLYDDVSFVPAPQKVSVALSPTKTNLAAGSSQLFTASVSGSTDKTVRVSVTGGTITGSGSQLTYTAPHGPGTYTITAMANADTSKSASAVITVVGPGPRTLFVASTGNDSYDCTSDASPCRTVSRAISLTSAGDTIRVHAGLYREHLSIIGRSGIPGSPITLSAYGDGEVILDNAPAVTGWTLDAGGIYKTNPGFDPLAVVIDNTPLLPAAQYGDPIGRASVTINPGQWFYDRNTSTLYVRSADGTSPESHDLIVLPIVDHALSANTAVYGYNSSYWTFDSLTIRGAGGGGIVMGGDSPSKSTHIILKNSKVWFNGWTGTYFGTYATVTNNTVAYNFMHNFPRGRCETYNANQKSVGYASCWIWGGWGGGLLVGGGYSTVTGNTVYMNGGEGLISYLGAGYNLIKNNTVYDNWSVNIYTDSEPYDTVDSNLVMCHDPDPKWSLNAGGANTIDWAKRVRPTGIGSADECYSGCGAAKMHHQTTVNNIIIGCKRGLSHYAQAPGSGMINETWANNTIILPSTNGIEFVGLGEPYNGIRIGYTPNNSDAVIRNNIVYGQGDTNVVVDVISLSAPNLSGIAFDHNLFYHPTNPQPFAWQDPVSGFGTYTFAGWEVIAAAQGQGSSDVYADPLLVNLTSFVAADKTLSNAGSPAKAAGSAVQNVLHDFNGFSYSNPPSIGAFEFGSTPTSIH